VTLKFALPIQTAILASIMLTLGACTTISITSPEGHTKIERSFGVASISVSSGDSPAVVQMTSIGFSSGPAGYAVGYSDQEITRFHDDCRVIFWVTDQNQAEAVLSVVNVSKGFCLHTPD
jgi:hypothetical protein